MIRVAAGAPDGNVRSVVTATVPPVSGAPVAERPDGTAIYEAVVPVGEVRLEEGESRLTLSPQEMVWGYVFVHVEDIILERNG